MNVNTVGSREPRRLRSDMTNATDLFDMTLVALGPESKAILQDLAPQTLHHDTFDSDPAATIAGVAFAVTEPSHAEAILMAILIGGAMLSQPEVLGAPNVRAVNNALESWADQFVEAFDADTRPTIAEMLDARLTLKSQGRI